MTKFMEPHFALVEVEGGYLVQRFNRQLHLTEHGWSRPNVNLFSYKEEVAHLRDLILN